MRGFTEFGHHLWRKQLESKPSRHVYIPTSRPKDAVAVPPGSAATASAVKARIFTSPTALSMEMAVLFGPQNTRIDVTWKAAEVSHRFRHSSLDGRIHPRDRLRCSGKALSFQCRQVSPGINCGGSGQSNGGRRHAACDTPSG